MGFFFPKSHDFAMDIIIKNTQSKLSKIIMFFKKLSQVSLLYIILIMTTNWFMVDICISRSVYFTLT